MITDIHSTGSHPEAFFHFIFNLQSSLEIFTLHISALLGLGLLLLLNEAVYSNFDASEIFSFICNDFLKFSYLLSDQVDLPCVKIRGFFCISFNKKSSSILNQINFLALNYA